MKHQSNLGFLSKSSLLPVAAIALTAGVFVFDTITKMEIAVPVFYTAVILISVQFCNRRGVVLVGAGCIFLTLLSDFLTPTISASESGIINTAISLLAIAATTYLAAKIQTAEGAVYEAREQLAHIARVTALGELTASIAHEVNQPLAATVINGNASLRWLSANPPNLEEAKQAVERIVKDATRAGEIIVRVRSLAKRNPPQKAWFNINEVIRETVILTASEIHQNRIALHTDFDDNLPEIFGDRIQVQQVVLNLLLNAIEAVNKTSNGLRELSISSSKEETSAALITIRDSGIGLKPEKIDQLFNAFYTTKDDGMGMGLTIGRSIIESHGGRIWATLNESRGATFRFTLPSERLKS
jgi:C4-dicarboxylate-specific signal transduction histidine kinase